MRGQRNGAHGGHGGTGTDDEETAETSGGEWVCGMRRASSVRAHQGTALPN